MPTVKKIPVQKPNGQMGLYYIETHGHHVKVMMPERVEQYTDLKKKEKTGELRNEFPNCKWAGPRALLGVTPEILEEALEKGGTSMPNGDFVTEDAEVCLRAWSFLERKGAKPTMHLMSLPLPDVKKGSKKAKGETIENN